MDSITGVQHSQGRSPDGDFACLGDELPHGLNELQVFGVGAGLDVKMHDTT